MEQDGGSEASGDAADEVVVWRHDPPYNPPAVVAITASAAVLGLLAAGFGIGRGDPFLIVLGAVLLVVMGFGIRSLWSPSSRWSVLVTDRHVVRVQRSGRRHVLARADAEAVVWDAERGSGIRRRGHLHGEWQVSLDHENARELAGVLGLPFHG